MAWGPRKFWRSWRPAAEAASPPPRPGGRLERYGENELERPAQESMLRRFLRQMKDPMIVVLLCAAGVSLWAGADGTGSTLSSFWASSCSTPSSPSPRRTAPSGRWRPSGTCRPPLARAVRDGQLCRVEAAKLVPGDILCLEAGDLVPADGRLLECAGLRTDESAMTGESAPAEKEACGALPLDTALGDRKNMVLSGTVVTGGRGICVVTGTGMRTEMGRIAGLLLEEGDGETPLQRKMGEISKSLSFLCLCVCAVMFGVGLLQGKNLLDMFLTAVSLAVAAIPEGLPAIVTIVLALGVQRMVRRSAIVKRLPAVETLGCAGVICSDKTGTLTQNRMTVTEVWSLGGKHRREALTIGALCSDAILTCKSAGNPPPPGTPLRPPWWRPPSGRAWTKTPWSGTSPGAESCLLTPSASS